MKNLLFIFAIVLYFGATGQNWYQLSVPTTNKLLAIDFPSSSIGYIVGEDTTILKTTDGGQTWNQLSTNGIQLQSQSYAINDVHFLDESIGFIVVGYSGTYKTLDGGQNWTAITGQSSNMCFPNTVHAFTENDYFIGGAGCFEGVIIDENNSGTWNTSTPSGLFWDSQQTVQEFDFRSNIGLAAAKNQYMLRSTDSGQSWDTIPTGIAASAYLTSVLIVNDTLCYAGYADDNGSGFGVLKSVDAGLTWAQDVNSATFFYPDYLCVASASNGDVYSGARPSNSVGGLIFETNITSVGIWDYATVDQPINDMDSYGNDITFGVGDSGYVVVNVPIAELGFQNLDVTTHVTLYPNPASAQLTVGSGSNILNIQAFNLAGSEVNVNSTIVNNKGFLDVSALASGIYNVLVQTENGVVAKRLSVEQ